MSFDPLSAAFILGKTAIEKIWPDPTKRAEEMRKLEELKQKGDLAQLNAHVQLMLAQINVNAQEAKHKSVFVAGWRPFIGWVGGIALAYQFVLYPLLLWVWSILEVKAIIPKGIVPPPVMDSGALWTIITGMLGIAGMRSYDKGKGTSKDSLRKE
jgi:hypothetical protein